MSTLAPGKFNAELQPEREDAIASEALGVDDLKDLMLTVTESSRTLQDTHVVLQKEVSRLQGELVEANVQLNRSRSLAALGGMAAGIAHEIRNPLGSIQLYVQMLAEDLAAQPEQVGICKKIDRAVSRLDAIVRDVLLFARDMRMAPRLMRASDLLERALESCEGLLVKESVVVSRVETEDCEFEIDEVLMVQALGNVIRNAVEAMVEDCHTRKNPREQSVGRLNLTVTKRRERGPDGRQAQRVVLGIEDDGPGISDDVIERMFNPFFTTRATGTGLGLAIVHRIVDAHCGYVNVTHCEPRGTRFEFCLKHRVSQDRAKAGNGNGDGTPSPANEFMELPLELETGT